MSCVFRFPDNLECCRGLDGSKDKAALAHTFFTDLLNVDLQVNMNMDLDMVLNTNSNRNQYDFELGS